MSASFVLQWRATAHAFTEIAPFCQDMIRLSEDYWVREEMARFGIVHVLSLSWVVHSIIAPLQIQPSSFLKTGWMGHTGYYQVPRVHIFNHNKINQMIIQLLFTPTVIFG